jgi:3'-5' exonuclease
MLNQIAIDEILFLDIETVPLSPSFEMLEEYDQVLWSDKSKFIREKNNISLEESYHQAGIYAEFGKIVCISVGYFVVRMGERLFRTTSFADHNEAVLLNEFAHLLEHRSNNPFRVLCAHNGKEFDFPYICRRMLINGISLPQLLDISGKKPWEIAHLDTMELWKFGDYKHYTSLKLLARIFGIPTPKDDIDGSMVRSVYYEEGNLDRISVYCQKDVATIAQLFLKYRNEKTLSQESIIQV